MSTSFPSEDASQKSGVSLRNFLSEAVFISADDIEVRRCSNVADQCQPGDVFIPKHTAGVDEHDQVELALSRGAVAVVADRLLPVSVPQCLVESTQDAFARVCQALAEEPSKRMLTIGVVGTHSKTTTTLFMASMLKKIGGSVAYYTSLGASDSTYCDREATRPPGAKKLANWLASADKAGTPAAIVELTPGMMQQEVAAGVEFDLLVVTGLRAPQTRGGVSVREQKSLLTKLSSQMKEHGAVLYNADDACAANWAEECDRTAISFGLDAAEHIRAKRLSRSGGEQQLLTTCGNLIMPMTLKMPGDHVARAALAAVATAWIFDFNVPEAIAGTEALTSIPGRMERVKQAIEVPVYVDAADTPDRLAIAAHALRVHKQAPATIVVDLSSRMESRWLQRLGEVLDRSTEKVVLSASELEPATAQALAMDVLGGVKAPGRVEIIPDRKAAIRWAIENTHQGSVLLAGKGEKSWCDREGDLTDDAAVAKDAITEKNSVTCPALGIFPPPGPNSYFPIDS